MVVTGSWDRTVKCWDTRTPTPAATLQLPERVYAMDVKFPLMVVATAERHMVLCVFFGFGFWVPHPPPPLSRPSPPPLFFLPGTT